MVALREGDGVASGCLSYAADFRVEAGGRLLVS